MNIPQAAAQKNAHPWSKEQLLAKAQRFSEEMLNYSKDEWRFGFWSSLSLELIGRAALAKISQALLADLRHWNHLYYALGGSPNEQKFVPKSIDASQVFARLRELLPAFTKEMEGFAVIHMNRRNEELHTGNVPFDSIKSTVWLPMYYQTCKILLESLDESLETHFGSDAAGFATKIIIASKDETAQTIKKTIAAHKTVWDGKSEREKEKLQAQASTWATRQVGHRVICPACSSNALLNGEPTSPPVKTLEGDLIVEKQEHLPSRFECVACNLKISGLSQLSACGLGDPYKVTSTYDAVDYYVPNDDYAGYEDDNNEY